MAAPKGHKRYGGREKGKLNQPTQELHDICETKGLNVFEAMCELAKSSLDESTRIAMLKELAQYLYPKRKAIEISNDGQEGFSIVIKDYTKKNE